MAHRTTAGKEAGLVLVAAHHPPQTAGPHASARFVPPPWLENIETNRDRQAIPDLERSVYLLLIQCRHEGRELRIVRGFFSLSDAKDPLPLPVAFDLGGNPETCFKHSLFLFSAVLLLTFRSLPIDQLASNLQSY